jgi:hypothetical protein
VKNLTAGHGFHQKTGPTQQLERAEQEMAQLKARIEELRRNFMDVITPNGKTRRGGLCETSAVK